MSIGMRKDLKACDKGYTLLGLVIAVAGLLVLITIAFLAYDGFVDRARAAACETNLKVLNTAVELYIRDERGAVPAVLGDLNPEHLKKAYAMVREDLGWQKRFLLAFLDFNYPGEAWAQFLTHDNLKGFGAVQDTFICPEDKNGGVSYGINSNLAGKLWYQIDKNVVVVGDCDSAVFSSPEQLKKRHGSGNVAIALTKGGAVTKIGDQSEGGEAVDDDATFDVDDAADDDDNSFGGISSDITALLNENPGGELETRLQDVLAKVSLASDKAAQSQNLGAVSDLEAAVGVIDTTVNDGLISAEQGQGIVEDLSELINDLQ